MPSFHDVNEGTDIKKYAFTSPYAQAMKKADVLVIEEETNAVYPFGRYEK